MRFGPAVVQNSLPFRPPELPESIYGTLSKTRKDKQKSYDKKKRAKLEDGLIKAIVSEMDPDFFKDPVIFPVSAEVLFELSKLSFADITSVLPRSERYTCVKAGNEFVLLDADMNIELAYGSMSQLMGFALNCEPRAMPVLLHAISDGIVPMPKRARPLTEMLVRYRYDRAFSLGLDRLSKMDEMECVDHEHVFSKFKPPDEKLSRWCYHIGAGNDLSGSTTGLLRFYEKVVAIDPRLIDGNDCVSQTYDQIDYEAGIDIYSDVAFGNDQGMIAENDSELINFLYGFASDRVVVVKYALQLGLCARGFVLRKPRPHNLEIIVHLHVDGESLDDIYHQYYDLVCSANEIRNTAVVTQRFSRAIKPLDVDQFDIADLLKAGIKRPLNYTPPSYVETPDKNEMIFAAMGGKRRSDRVARFADLVYFNRNDQPLGPHAKRLHIDLALGRVESNDPGYADPEFSANTVIHAVRCAGLRIIRNNGTTLISKQKKRL